MISAFGLNSLAYKGSGSNSPPAKVQIKERKDTLVTWPWPVPSTPKKPSGGIHTDAWG